jgi:hypothetical protein
MATQTKNRDIDVVREKITKSVGAEYFHDFDNAVTVSKFNTHGKDRKLWDIKIRTPGLSERQTEKVKKDFEIIGVGVFMSESREPYLLLTLEDKSQNLKDRAKERM